MSPPDSPAAIAVSRAQGVSRRAAVRLGVPRVCAAQREGVAWS